MIEIRTSNGGRGFGFLTNVTPDHLEFQPRDHNRVMWVPVALVTLVQPVCT